MRRRRAEQPQSAPMEPAEEGRFPFLLLLLAVIGLTGFYHELLISLPGRSTRGSLWGLSRYVLFAFEFASVHLGGRPIVALILFVVVLAPGLLFPYRSRRHFTRISIWSLALWTACFLVTGEPTRELGRAIHEILSVGREFPGTLPSR